MGAGMYILIALIIGELLALIGVMGIVAELLQEGIRILTDGKTVNTALDYSCNCTGIVSAFLVWPL